MRHNWRKKLDGTTVKETHERIKVSVNINGFHSSGGVPCCRWGFFRIFKIHFFLFIPIFIRLNTITTNFGEILNRWSMNFYISFSNLFKSKIDNTLYIYDIFFLWCIIQFTLWYITFSAIRFTRPFCMVTICLYPFCSIIVIYSYNSFKLLLLSLLYFNIFQS